MLLYQSEITKGTTILFNLPKYEAMKVKYKEHKIQSMKQELDIHYILKKHLDIQIKKFIRR